MRSNYPPNMNYKDVEMQPCEDCGRSDLLCECPMEPADVPQKESVDWFKEYAAYNLFEKPKDRSFIGIANFIVFTAIIALTYALIVYAHDITSLQPYNLITYPVTPEPHIEQGKATWYDYELDGVEWSKDHDTCASRTLKRYKTYYVENVANGKVITCFVNDFGPEEWTGKVLDLSSHAFAQLAPLSVGVIEVRIYEVE